MIIGFLFWGLVIITIISLGLLMIGYLEDNEDLFTPGFMLLLVVTVIGWGMFGNIIPLKTKTIEITANVLRDSQSVHLSYSNNIIATYKDVATYEYLIDKQSVAVDGTYKLNMYGRVCNNVTNWTFPNK